MDISVIICTYNRAESLRRTLQSCRELLVPEGVTWELLIVDNNSTDHTQKVCEEFVYLLPLRCLFEPRQGKTFALNMAVEAAVGELLVFTDDDLAVDSNWLKGLWAAALRHPEISFFGGRVLPRWESPPPKWLAENLDWLLFNVHVDRGDKEEIVTDVVFPGANLAFRSSIFRAGIRFREEICPSGDEHSLWGNVRGEETEMERELLATKQKGMYVPNAVVHHYHQAYRCTEKYLRLYYAGLGVRIVRIGAEDIPVGRGWFTPPLWYWLRFARRVMRYGVLRVTAPDREWLKAEIDMSTTWGIIREYRRLAKYRDRTSSGVGRANAKMFSSSEYWEMRYSKGGNSGDGSYGALSNFKAQIINRFIAEKSVQSVLELGCGDGNQLALYLMPKYIGADVSWKSIERCRNRFKNDENKQFLHMSDIESVQAVELALSIDVIFHLVEDAVYSAYMEKLFAKAHRYVGIYSSDFNIPAQATSCHVRHRHFTTWINQNQPDWKLILHVPNALPSSDVMCPDDRTSFCDFFFFEKSNSQG